MRTAHLARGIAGALLGAWLFPLAHGQAADHGTSAVREIEVVLHIRDAVELALPRLDRTGPEMSRWRLVEAEGRLWPTVSLRPRYSFESSQVVQESTQTIFGAGLSIQRWGVDLGVSYNLLQFLESGPRIRGALAEELASVLRLNQVESERALRVVEAYMTLLAEREALAAVEPLRREHQAHLAKQERRHAADQIPAIEVVRARSQVAATERDAIALKRRAASAELELRRLTGLPPEVRISQLFEPEELDLSLIAAEGAEGLLDLARDGNPRLLAANLAVEAARWDSEAIRARNSYPTFSVWGSYGYGHDDFFNSTTFENTDFRYSIFAILDIPLFDGGVRRAQIAQSNLTAESRLQEARRVAEDVKAQIEDSYYAFFERERTREMIEQEVALAEDELSQATARLAAGLGSEAEMLSALSRLARLRRDLARARADEAIKGVELILAVGRNPLAGGSSTGPSGREPRAPADLAEAEPRPAPTASSPPPAVTPRRPGATAVASLEVAPAEPRAPVHSREERAPAPDPRPARPGAAAPLRALTQVRITDLAAVTTVELVADGPLSRYSTVRLARPSRLVIDLPDVEAAASLLAAESRGGTPLLARARVRQYPDKVRVVLDLAQDPAEPPQIVEHADRLEVILVRGK